MTSTPETTRRRAFWRAPVLGLALPALLTAQAAYLSPGPQLPGEGRAEPPPTFERRPIESYREAALPESAPEAWPDELPTPLAAQPVRTSLAIGLEAARSDRDFRLVLGQELARVVSDDIARRAEDLDIALAGLITSDALEALPGERHRVEPLGTAGTYSPHVVGPVYLTRTRLPVSEEHAPTTLLSRVGLTEHGVLRVLDRHLAVVDGVRIYGPPALVQDFVELSYPEWYQSVD